MSKAKVPTKWFRFHRGSFEESMQMLHAIKSIDDIVTLVNGNRMEFESVVTREQVVMYKYGYDSRLGCDVNIVSVSDRVLGFTNMTARG